MNKFDSMYMDIAQALSQYSYCERSRVGALIVVGRQIVAEGYNGNISGFDNKCEDEDGNSLKTILHAESNAITKAAKSSISTSGGTLYTTLSPCFECAKLIIQSGIVRIVYFDEYRDEEPLSLLRKANVEVEKF